MASVTEDELLGYLQIASLTMNTVSLRGELGWANISPRALNPLNVLPGGTDATLCPNIRNISFDDCIYGPLPQNAMSDMVRSRILHSPTMGLGGRLWRCIFPRRAIL